MYVDENSGELSYSKWLCARAVYDISIIIITITIISIVIYYAFRVL